MPSAGLSRLTAELLSCPAQTAARSNFRGQSIVLVCFAHCGAFACLLPAGTQFCGGGPVTDPAHTALGVHRHAAVAQDGVNAVLRVPLDRDAVGNVVRVPAAAWVSAVVGVREDRDRPARCLRNRRLRPRHRPRRNVEPARDADCGRQDGRCRLLQSNLDAGDVVSVWPRVAVGIGRNDAFAECGGTAVLPAVRRRERGDFRVDRGETRRARLEAGSLAGPSSSAAASAVASAAVWSACLCTNIDDASTPSAASPSSTGMISAIRTSAWPCEPQSNSRDTSPPICAHGLQPPVTPNDIDRNPV